MLTPHAAWYSQEADDALYERIAEVAVDRAARRDREGVDRMSLILCERDGAVALVTLNRPDQLNALSTALEQELAATLASAQVREASALIIRGAGERAFSAGADTGELDVATPETALAYYERPATSTSSSRGWPCRRSRRSTAGAWAAGSRWRWPAICAWRPRARASGSPRSSAASSRRAAARPAPCGHSARPSPGA